MKEALRALLLANKGVAAQVGTRIAWATRPRGSALPTIALHLIDSIRDYEMDGPSRLVRSRVQVDCWAQTNAAATATSRAVVSAISALRTTYDGVQFQGVFGLDERDLTDEANEAEELLHRVSLDFEIWHSE